MHRGYLFSQGNSGERRPSGYEEIHCRHFQLLYGYFSRAYSLSLSFAEFFQRIRLTDPLLRIYVFLSVKERTKVDRGTFIGLLYRDERRGKITRFLENLAA